MPTNSRTHILRKNINNWINTSSPQKDTKGLEAIITSQELPDFLHQIYNK